MTLDTPLNLSQFSYSENPWDISEWLWTGHLLCSLKQYISTILYMSLSLHLLLLIFSCSSGYLDKFNYPIPAIVGEDSVWICMTFHCHWIWSQLLVIVTHKEMNVVCHQFCLSVRSLQGPVNYALVCLNCPVMTVSLVIVKQTFSYPVIANKSSMHISLTIACLSLKEPCSSNWPLVSQSIIS